MSFATYFNAFPASYWRRWTICKSVVLRVEVSGSGRVDVYRTKATGARIFIEGRAVRRHRGCSRSSSRSRWGCSRSRTAAGSGSTSPPTPRSAWSAAAGMRPSPLRARPTSRSASRRSTAPRTAPMRWRELTADPLVDEVIGAVIVPDQGVRKVRDHPDFPAAAARLGNRLSIHDQPNLGGSGGYSRVMYEALKNTDCQQILFMDDDIRIEPDSILRVLAMHRFAKSPDAGGRPDAQPAGAVAPAHHGRDRQPVELHVDRRAARRVRPRLRRISVERQGTIAASCCTAASTSTTTAGGRA